MRVASRQIDASTRKSAKFFMPMIALILYQHWERLQLMLLYEILINCVRLILLLLMFVSVCYAETLLEI